MSRRGRIGGLAVLFLVSAKAALADAGPSPPEDAGPGDVPVEAGADAESDGWAGGEGRCTSSADCPYPTAYCHATLRTCVTCLTNDHCSALQSSYSGSLAYRPNLPFRPMFPLPYGYPGGSSLSCDVSTGECVGCFGDENCTYPTPYCDPSARQCVRCVSDRNCGSPDLVCRAGSCVAARCGDGVCAEDERAGFTGDVVGLVRCDEDCAPLCAASVTLDHFGGEGVRLEFSGARRVTGLGCADRVAVERFVRLVPPRDGPFELVATPTPPEALVGWAQIPSGGDCTTETGYCRTFRDSPLVGSAGVPIEIVVSAPAEATLTVQMLEARCTDSSCLAAVRPGEIPCCLPSIGCGLYDGFQCAPRPATPTDGGIVVDPLTPICRANAAARGDAQCEGVDCACARCPQAYDDCALVPGCTALLACMAGAACAGADCYVGGACRAAIDSAGGLSGAAFRAASALRSCSTAGACALPCSGAPGAGGADAGADGRDAATGQRCEPGLEVVCPCDGGSGTRRCSPDGESFTACECGGAGPDAGSPADGDPEAAARGGCSCRAAAGTEGDAGGLAFAAAVVGLGAARRRRRGRSGG